MRPVAGLLPHRVASYFNLRFHILRHEVPRHLGTTFWDFIAAGFGVISQCGVTGYFKLFFLRLDIMRSHKSTESHFSFDADGQESIYASMVHISYHVRISFISSPIRACRKIEILEAQ